MPTACLKSKEQEGVTRGGLVAVGFVGIGSPLGFGVVGRSVGVEKSSFGEDKKPVK